MSDKLAMNTTVDGETYEAGTVPPAAVAKKINNPKAWGLETKAPAADETTADVAADDEGNEDADTGDDEPKAPAASRRRK